MNQLRPHISINEKRHLTIGRVDAAALAEKFGTPLYVYDENRIRERYREFYKSFSFLYPNVEIKYACKANASLAVLCVLRQEGAGADVVSGGELYTALKAGLKPEQVIFTGNSKSDEELEQAIEAGVIVNLDALHELERLKEICERKKKSTKISFRINPAVAPKTHAHLTTGAKASKFGIPVEDTVKAYTAALESKHLKISGIHMHIGSQITSTEPYEIAVSKLMDAVGRLKKAGIELEFVDIGGGVGIRYEEEKRYITPRGLANTVVPILKAKVKEHGLKEPKLFLEPGRYVVGDAAIMLARVGTIKQMMYKKFVGVDAGFNVLLRPMLYKAYHKAVVANKFNLKPVERVDIVGNICESGDILASDRALPKVECGDIIAFLDVGAYGMAMASQYNSRPRCAEVLVSNGKYELIRERESFEDLLAKQRVPKRLEK